MYLAGVTGWSRQRDVSGYGEAGNTGRNQSTFSLLIISNLGKIRRFPKPHESGFGVEGNTRCNQSLLSLLIFTKMRVENKIFAKLLLSVEVMWKTDKFNLFNETEFEIIGIFCETNLE